MYALNCTEETVIEIKDGSSNTIEQQFVGSNKGGNCAVIHSEQKLTMIGSGSLKLVTNNSNETRTKGLHVATIANLIGVNITLDVIDNSYIHAILVGSESTASSTENITLKI